MKQVPAMAVGPTIDLGDQIFSIGLRPYSSPKAVLPPAGPVDELAPLRLAIADLAKANAGLQRRVMELESKVEVLENSFWRRLKKRIVQLWTNVYK